MTLNPTKLLTPIYVQDSAQPATWPADKVFYRLANNGLFLCRNHEYFRSAVPAPRWPTELGPQPSFVDAHFPLIERELLELVVGFFDRAYMLRGAESVVLLAVRRGTQRLEVVVPEQLATSYRNWRGEVLAENVRYTPPLDLAADLTCIGDIHCHCDMAAYSSAQDKSDETYVSGLHLVVGHMDREPPQFHAEVVVDGQRFIVDPKALIAGYQRRNKGFPSEWLDRHRVEYQGYQPGGSYGGTNDNYWSSY
jgi:hypothetical protein